MAAGEDTPPTSLHDITSQFVKFYYTLRQENPTRLVDVYTDDSKVGRVAADGFIYNTTKQEAFEQNTLLVGGRMSAALKKIDAQFSINNCVLIVVKGNLVGDDVFKSFTQTFFLAPILSSPTPGYYVYNDIFRYEDDEVGLDLEKEEFIEGQHAEEEEFVEEQNIEEEQGLADTVHVSPNNGHTSWPEQEKPIAKPLIIAETRMTGPPITPKAVAKAPAAVTPATNHLVAITPVAKLAAATTQVAKTSVAHPSSPTIVEAVPMTKLPEAEPSLSTTDEASASKPQTYDSVLSERSTLLMAPPSAPMTRQPISSTSKSLPSSSAPAGPLPTAPAITVHLKAASSVTSNAAKDNNDSEVDPYGIYVRNLNPYVSPEELKREFDQFGPVKPSLVRIFHNQRTLRNYAFLEFELKSSATKAIERGEIWIQGPAKIEAKRRFPLKWRNEDTNRGSTSRGGSQGAYVQVANANSRPGNSRNNPRNTASNSRNSKSAAPPKRYS